MIPATRLNIAGVLLCLAIVLSACAGQPSTQEGNADPMDSTAPASSRRTPVTPARQPITLPPEATQPPVPATEENVGDNEDDLPRPAIPLTPQAALTLQPGTVSGEVPEDLLATIRQDLAARLQVSAKELTVVRAETATWRDSSLGCPQKGMHYLQVIVYGYWVVLSDGDRTYDYRVDDRGYFILCEQLLLEGIVPPGDGGGPVVDQ
jgi:hypothetical protein